MPFTWCESAIVPLYNGETAPKKIRGAMLVLYQLQIIFGYARGTKNV